MHNVLLDPKPPTSEEALMKLGDQMVRFLFAAATNPKIAAALGAQGYDAQIHLRGQEALHTAFSRHDPSDEDKRALHAWLWTQHLRALGAELKRSQLIALGVVMRRVREKPEQSGIVLRMSRRR
jgi:hypothetical protein